MSLHDEIEDFKEWYLTERRFDVGTKKEYTVIVGSTPVYIGAIRTAHLVAGILEKYRDMVIEDVGTDYSPPNVLVAFGAHYQ